MPGSRRAVESGLCGRWKSAAPSWSAPVANHITATESLTKKACNRLLQQNRPGADSCAAQKASYSITSSARGRLSSPFAIGRQAPLRAVAFLAQKIHERLECRPHLAATRIIKKKSSRRSWCPFVQSGHKPALSEIQCDEDGRPL